MSSGAYYMKKSLSKTVQELQPSGIREFFDLVLGMKDVISLGVGEPDFTTPWVIREAGIYALEQGFTSYTSNKGLYKLRLGISRYLNSRFNLKYNPEEEILITTGVSEAMDLALRAVVNPGDEVIIPLPCYVAYGPLTILAGGLPRYIKTQLRQGFKLKPEDLERAITKRTKAVILNYPGNPTGVSYTNKELADFKRIILKHKILCITDEIYGDLSYDFAHIPFASLSGAGQFSLYLNGFSKAYAMTGWRIGYACGCKDVISAMTKIHQYTMLCAPIMSQLAAYEALVSGKKAMDEMKREYQRRREYVYEELKRIGFEMVKPQGAFYFFISTKNTGLAGLNFARKLLKEQNVAVVPGDAFGSDYKDFVRLSYCADLDKLKEAIARIEKFLRRKQ